MASLSSVSSSNSLGNTSLRGFGGMASGIDRDAIIEQMTLGTNTKIESQRSNMTKLQWKQEAYRGITDQILDLTDKYASYSSTSNLKDPTLFSKSLVTVHGAESSTRFVTATGTSKLVENVAITGVKQLATSTVRRSNKHSVTAITTKELNLMQEDAEQDSKLKGSKLWIGTYDQNYEFTKAFEFEFKSSYTISTGDGKSETKTIDYKRGDDESAEAYAKRLAGELNEMITNTETYKGTYNADRDKDDLSKTNIWFKAEGGKLLLGGLSYPSSDGSGNKVPVQINSSRSSTALSALGYKHSGNLQGVSVGDFNTRVDTVVGESSIVKRSVIDTLAGQKLIFEYNGSQKSVEIFSNSEAAALKNAVTAVKGAMENLESASDDEKEAAKEALQNAENALNAAAVQAVDNLQLRLNSAFGDKSVKVTKSGDGKNFSLAFKTEDEESTVSILSNDNNLLDALDVEFGESNKVNVDGKLDQAALGLDKNAYTDANGQLNLKINGVSITGLTANSSISDILSKINSTTAAGVKATYVDATGEFMLVSSETGEGRHITLDSALADKLFGGYSGTAADGTYQKKMSKEEIDQLDKLDETQKSENYETKDGKIIRYSVNKDGKLEEKADGEYIKVKYKAADVDDRGNIKIVHKFDKDGKETQDDTKIEKVVTNYIGKDGNEVNEAGYRVDAHGRMIDADGFFIDKSGNLVDKNGKLVAVVDQKGERVSKENFKIDENGDYVAKDSSKNYSVKHIDPDGHFVVYDDANDKNKAYLSDINGKHVDKEGFYINENNVRVIEGVNGNKMYVSRDGYEVDEKGNYIGKDGSLVGRFTGGWYQVAEDGNVLGQYYIKKDGDVWYRADKDGNYIDKDGNKVDGEKREKIEVPNGFLGEAGKDVTEVHVKNVAGTWYRTDKDGNYIDKDGNKVNDEKREKIEVPNGFDATPMQPLEKLYSFNDDDGSITIGRIAPDYKGKRVDKEGYELGEDGKRIGKDPLIKTGYNPTQHGVGSTVNIGRPVNEGLYKAEGLVDNEKEGQNAVISVSYGDGRDIELKRASNTFNLEGLTVTVTGTFGGKYEEKEVDGRKVQEWKPDSSQTVTFSAKADVDKALETVKAFFEDFNALVTEINGQVTARPDSNYGPLTSAQKEEMDETSIENWEKKAKQGILFGDDVMRDLSGSMEGILAKLMSYGVNYQDLEKIGITYSEDYLDGGTLVFDESKFRSTMESDPDLVSKIISGGESGGKGLIHVVEDAVTPYATRYASKNGNSYGRLVEVAGTEKKPTTLMSNQIYKQLKEMQETIDKLQSQLKVEQDRYISQFTTMESLLNQMNTQSSYLSQLTA